MTSRLGRWVDWVLASPTPAPESRTNISPTYTSQEPAMPNNTAVRSTSKRIEQLRAELDAITDEAATDPIEHALLLADWETRELQRNQRRLQITAELRRRQELGGLADDPDVTAAIASYVNRTAEHRAALAPVARDRAWPSGKSDGRAVQRLEKWLHSLEDLSRQLPDGDADADSYVERQLIEWFAAREGVLVAKASAAGSDVPQPELRQMPRGFAFGLHRP